MTFYSLKRSDIKIIRMSSFRPKLSFVHIYWIQVFLNIILSLSKITHCVILAFFYLTFILLIQHAIYYIFKYFFFQCVVWRWVLSFCVEGSISTFQYFLFVCLFTNISVTTAYKLAFHVSFFLNFILNSRST